MKTYTFHFYSDPGHGWLAVKRTVLHMLRVEDKITPYSYQRGQTVYLEEDCDLSTVLQAMKERQIPYAIVEHITDRRSPIRSYDRYRNEPKE